jgi:hypothetical protein
MLQILSEGGCLDIRSRRTEESLVTDERIKFSEDLELGRECFRNAFLDVSGKFGKVLKAFSS